MRKFRITTQRAVIEVMAEDEENALNKAKTVSTSVEFFPGVCNIRESKKPGSWGLTDEEKERRRKNKERRRINKTRR